MSTKSLIAIMLANCVALIGASISSFDAVPMVIIFVGLAIISAIKESK